MPPPVTWIMCVSLPLASKSHLWSIRCTAADSTTDRQLFGVSLAGKQRAILKTPQSTRLLDIAADGRALLSNERQQTEITGIDPATGKERRGMEWFDASIMG